MTDFGKMSCLAVLQKENVGDCLNILDMGQELSAVPQVVAPLVTLTDI